MARRARNSLLYRRCIPMFTTGPMAATPVSVMMQRNSTTAQEQRAQGRVAAPALHVRCAPVGGAACCRLAKALCSMAVHCALRMRSGCRCSGLHRPRGRVDCHLLHRRCSLCGLDTARLPRCKPHAWLTRCPRLHAAARTLSSLALRLGHKEIGRRGKWVMVRLNDERKLKWRGERVRLSE